MTDEVLALAVKDASGTERVVPLDRDVIAIGRDPTCTIRLDSPYVSRQHARVERRADGLTLVDLGSRNGSLLNGRRVEHPVPLGVGDVITIGDVTITCLGEPAPAETTLDLIPRKTEPPPDDRLRVDAQLYEVTIGGQRLERRLSAQEFRLLCYLYEHAERVCTRQELGDAIWGSGNWDANMLHRLVHRMKEKLEPNPEKPRYVQTVPQVGYRVTP